jgi:hypothetical protein
MRAPDGVSAQCDFVDRVGCGCMGAGAQIYLTLVRYQLN